jgi:hypothetical protein
MGAAKLSTCPDCGTAAGQRHQRTDAGPCAIGLCFWCGTPERQCVCTLSHGRRKPRSIWTGDLPGAEECHRLGLRDASQLLPRMRWCPVQQGFVPRDGGPPAPATYQDIVDQHLLAREKVGERWTAPPTDYFHNGTRIGAQVRVSLRPRPGDVIAYADSGELFAFKVQA